MNGPLTSRRVYIAGHNGMVGAAILRQLASAGYSNMIHASHDQLDCRDQSAVNAFFNRHHPQIVIVAAARVGGIHANHTFPADFIYDNLMIEANLIKAAHDHDVQTLVFLGSSCIYPRLATQPMTEDQLLSGMLEPTNEPYAIAKIAGIKLCESFNRQHGRDFRSLMPTNLYGTGDNFHPENSHVIPALMRRFHEARLNKSANVTIWGTGQARREFLHVDDLAVAVRFILELDASTWRAAVRPQQSHINVGTGTDISIGELATLMKTVTGFTGELVFDTSKPDGTPRKLLDTSLINRLGWHARVNLEDGLHQTYDWFKTQAGTVRGT
jgi:GDP-L-fucose synthase